MGNTRIRWLVRDTDGKIFGPLSTEKVINEISAGFFSGNEDVSLYPDGHWIAISKEAKFYDALLDVLDKEIQGVRKPTEKPPEVNQEMHLEPELSKTGEPPRGVDRGVAEQEENPHDMVTQSGAPEPEEGLTRVEEGEEEDSEEVIELTDVHQIKKREKVKASSKPLLFFVVGVALIIAFLFIGEDSGPKLRLLSPQKKGGASLSKKQVAQKLKRALAFFEKDTHNNYKRAQNELVQVVESNRRVLDAYELLCMSYHYLWPFSYQDSKDIDTVKYVTRRAKQIDPTSRAAIVCDIIQLMVSGRYPEASGIASNTLRSSPQFVFVNQIYGELLESRKQYETAKYYFSQAKELWVKKPPWLAPKVFEARMYTYLKGADEQRNMAYAFRLYREVLKANPNHAVAKIELGKVEFNYFKHVDKGLNLTKDGLSSNEKLPKTIEVEAYITLAKIYKRKNERRIALDYAQKAYSINSSNKASRELIIELGGMEGLRNTKLKERELLYVGDQYVKSGDCFAAQAEFKAAFEVDPKNGIAAMKAAKCLWELNQSEEAIAWLKKAINADPKLTPAYVELADYFSQRYDFLSAVRVLTKIRRINPKSYEVFRGFALVELRRMNFQGAVTFGLQALKLYDTDVQSSMILAKAYMGLEEFNEAFRYVNRAIELDSNNVEAHCIYAKVLTGLRGSMVGIEYLKKKINNFPKISAYREALGEIYLQEEQVRSARVMYNQVVQLDPNNKNAFLKLGQILQQERLVNEALEIYLRAAQLDPSDANPIFLAGKLYMETKKPGLALRQFNRVIEINKRFPLAHYSAGKASIAINNYKAALDYAKAERQINPGMAESYLLAAEAYFRLKQFQNCAEEYQKATAKSDQGSMVYVKLGRCYRLAGALDSAVSSLKLASAQESGNPFIYLELGSVYEMQGNNDAAIESFEKYLGLAPNAPDRSKIQRKISNLTIN